MQSSVCYKGLRDCTQCCNKAVLFLGTLQNYFYIPDYSNTRKSADISISNYPVLSVTNKTNSIFVSGAR